MVLWNILTRLARQFQPRSILAGRELQLHLDTASLYKTLPPQPHRLPTSPPTPEQCHIARLLDLPRPLPPFEYQAAAIKAHLHSSTAHVLRALLTSFATPCPVQSLREALTFQLRIDSSTISAAGQGVFVDGFVRAGTVVTLYPGVSYLPSQVRRSGLIENLASRADYFISRYDGVVVDGSAQVQINIDTLAPNTPQVTAESRPHEESDESFVHPLGLGHFVNHPPKRVSPNILQFMLDLDLTALPRDLRSLVPCRSWNGVHGVLDRMENEAFRQRVPSSSVFVSGLMDPARVTRTIALVATRDIENEELFMNYRFNPQAPAVPDWYWDCDPEGSARRWKEKGVFF